MKNLTLYNEIKAAIARSMEAEDNAQAWKKIAKEEMADAKTIIAAAKKVNKGDFPDPADLIAVIKAEIAATNAIKSDEDTDPTDYAPGDFPGNNAPEELAQADPGTLENPIDPTEEPDPTEEQEA